MPFKKANVNVEIEQMKRDDPEFAEAYEIISAEYDLIESVAKLRKELGVTQPELAEKTGLTQQTISRMEKVGHSPTLRSFIRYLSGLGLEIEIKKRVGQVFRPRAH